MVRSHALSFSCQWLGRWTNPLPPDAKWRYKKAPDYDLTNATFETTKSTDWAPDSLEGLIQNLVKNWEKEASYKVDPKEWRTISQESYSFHINGGPGMSADDMLQVGTYNALIGEAGIKGVYETKEMDFSKSHKLFKGAMKTFNWEVIEVLGAPPKVSVKWRHWGMLPFPFHFPRRQNLTKQQVP